MAARLLSISVMVGLVAGQLQPPANVTTVPGDSKVTVYWTPQDGGTAKSYDISAQLQHPYPSELRTDWVFVDQFDRTYFDTTRWDYTSSTCKYQYSGYNCWTTLPSVAQSGGSMNMSAPGYSYFPYSWGVGADSANLYGRDGVGFATPKGVTGGNFIYANTTHQYMFTATIRSMITTSSSTYLYSNAGFVLYDLDSSGFPHWIMRYYLVWYNEQQYSYLYYEYPYHYNNNQNGYRNQYWLASIPPSFLPMTMQMLHDGTPASISSRRWKFGYSWPSDTTGAAWTDSGYGFWDSDLYYFGGYYNPNYDNLRVALFAESTYIYNIVVRWEWFGVFPTTSGELQNRANWYKYWSLRNQTIASFGICATSRDLKKTVTSDITSVTLTGLDMASGYLISVAANDGTTRTAYNVSVNGVAYPALTIPGGVPNPLLYLDANTVSASGANGISTWKDVTKTYTFTVPSGSTGPFLRPKSSKVPYATVEFKNANSDLELLGSDSDPLWQHDASFTNHEMSIFMVYQPKNAAYYGQNSAVVARGGYFGYSESGWAVYGVNYYYSWTCATSCMYVYGFSYGAHVKNGDYDGTAIYGKYAEGAYGTPGAHPHSTTPTLVTYNYKATPSGGMTYQMDACQGVVTGSNDNCNTGNVIGAVPAAGVNQWSPGTRISYYPQYVTNNIQSYGSWTVNTKQKVRLGALGWTYSWWSYSYDYIVDKMTGDLHALMIYKSGTGLTNSQIVSAQSFLADRYFLRCPAVPAAPNSNGGCSMANTGSVCTLSCATGYSRAGGSTNLRCSAGFFVGKNIYCVNSCPSIASPPDYATCSKYFVYDEFAGGKSFADLIMYDVAPALPASQASSYWLTNAQNQLVGTAPTLDDSCSALSPSALFVNQPAWLSTVRLTDPLTAEVFVNLDPAAKAGLVFRVLSNQTYYRFTVVGGGYSYVEKIVGGSAINNRWRNVSAVVTDPGKWYMISAFAQVRSQTDITNDIIIKINGTVVWNISDADIPVGSAGISIISGRAKFDNFGVYGSCDSNGDSCQNLLSGMECQYTCKAGFGLRGDYRQRCGVSGAITTTTPECVPLPPTILPQSFNISEAATVNTVSGTVKATSAGPGQVIIFSLLQTNNNETMRDRFGNVLGTASEIFRVGTCSGELLLNVAGVLDFYYGTKVFNLMVRGCANGRNDSCTDAAISVTVLRAPRAPVFEIDTVSGQRDTWIRNVAENTAFGITIPPEIAAFTPEPNPILYSIAFGNSDYIFGIRNFTGMLFVNRSVLNFEKQNLYTILVTARDSVYTNLSNSVVVQVKVSDVNDPPTAVAVQEIQIIENQYSKLDAMVGFVRGADEDSGDVLTYAFVSGSNANLTLNSSTGMLSVMQPKGYNPELDEVIIVNGLQTRDTLTFDVRITDKMGASVVSRVIVYVIANITAAGLPTFDSVEVPAGGLRTTGGETIVLRGQNLDTIPKIALDPKKLYVYYSSQVQDPWTRNYTALNCTVMTADTATCISPPGFGSGLAITAKWGTLRRQVLTSTVLLVNYRQPVVTSICGNCYTAGGDARNVPTAGGLVLKLTGTNFGPEFLQTPASQREPWPVEVRYGNNFEYRAFPFYVTGAPYSAHSVLYFSAVEGVGSDLPLKVTVGGIESPINNVSAAITYGKPKVTALVVPNGAAYTASNFSTGGRQPFTVVGINFGPDTYDVIVRYSVNKTVLVNNQPTFLQFSYLASCKKPTGIAAHTTLSCTSAPGVGSGLLLTVAAAGQVSPRDPLIAISYGFPAIQFVKGPGSRLADTAGGQQVNLQGDNMGPMALGDGTPDTLTYTPITATYGKTGTEYLGVDCKVTSDIPNVISCLTAPGTGTNHTWRVIVGGLDGGVYQYARTGYAPPVVSTFSRTMTDAMAAKETDGYSTIGGETVIITGKNFGPSIVTGDFQALYRTSLRDPLTDAPLWDAPNTTAALGDARGTLTYVPSVACVMTTPHKVLSCTTERGAGADLQWVITVDGQISTFPSTGYDRPHIRRIVAADQSSAVTAASTDGSDIMFLKGDNFGPRLNCKGPGGSDPCMGYVQAVRYGLNGVEKLALSFTVISHDTIKITLGPGFGQNLRVTVTVADQESDPSDDVFSYGIPTILSVSPITADTNPTATSPTTITIVGRDFSLLDSQAQVGILFGNVEDNTQSPLLPLQSADPTWTDAAGAAAHVPGSAHVITFLLPQGLGADRAIRVVVYERGKPTGYSITSTASIGTSSFSYRTPNIMAVIVQTPDAIRSANSSVVQEFIRMHFDTVANPQIYALTILGSNFGPPATQTSDSISRLVEGRPDALTAWDPTWATVFQWTHKELVVFTTESRGTVRVNGVANSFLGGATVTNPSNEYDYYDMSPSIGNLVGTPGPYDTRGGAVIGFTIKHLASLISNLTATVGGRNCPLLTLENEIVDPTNVRAAIVLNTSYFVTPNAPAGAINADTTWTIYCRIPEGEGTLNSLVIRRDNDASNTDVLIVYSPPSIISYSIEQEDGSWVTTPYVFGAGSIVVPNDGARINITGLNFGICPSAYMGEGPLVRLGRQGVCSNLDADTFASHTSLEFKTVKGDGRGFTFVITVGGQDTTSQFPIAFDYIAPTVSYFSPEGRTAGGDIIEIIGKNLGVYRIPIVTIGAQACTNVVSFNSTYATCILAEGSGGGKTVIVSVNAQTWTRVNGFRYSLPIISVLSVNDAAYTSDARGATKGGYFVELFGDNFGISDYDNHCLFVAWRNRQGSLSCSRKVEFLGEGELPLFVVPEWNHTYVKFVMPPGIGGFDIVPLVFGQEPLSHFVFRYTSPNITASLDPNHGGTNGGDLITVTGINFGSAALDTSNPSTISSLFPTLMPADLNEYLTLPRAPLASVAVNFFKSCISSSLDATGNVPFVVATCVRNGIVSHKHDQIKFISAGGIGVNRSVSVTIFDEEPDPVNIGQKIRFATTSNIVFFSYDPPKVTASTDNPVLQVGGNQTNIATLYGINFGSRALQDVQQWTFEERKVDVVIDYTPAISVERVADTLEVILPDLTVGHKNITYTVAGQAGFTPYTSFASIFTACLGGRKDYKIYESGPWPGNFGRPGEYCAACPRGAVCAGFDTEQQDNPESIYDGGTHTYPVPIIGWYNLNTSMKEICPESLANVYPGRDVCIVPCEPAEACLGANICADPYKSVAPYYRCATCNDGFYRRANECVKCPDSPWALVIGFCFLVMAGGGISYFLNKRKINLAFISIGIDYFQVIAIFAQSKVQWPPALKELFHILSAFNLNIEIVAPECIVPNLAYRSKWGFIMALPFALTCFFALLTLVSSTYKGLIKGQRVKVMNQGAALAASVLLLMYIMYIYLTRNVLEVFNCTPTDPPDGKTYMTAVFEECGKPGGSQMALLPWGILTAAAYVAGYPAALGYLLYKNRENIMEDQLLRAKNVGNDKLTNPHCYHLRKRWSRTYYQFKPDLYFWTMVIILRKFCIAATYILFNKNAAFQLAAAMLIMFLAYAAQVIYYPYMSPADYESVLKDHEKQSFSSPIHARLRATISGIETRGRKSVRKNLMNNEGKIDARALLGVLRGWLFNYNTVEEILLFSAVIVALMGIMYSSNTSTNAVKNAYYASARDAVTGVVMAVIITTIVYFIIVVVTEISIMSAEAQRRKVAQMSSKGKSGEPGSPKSPGGRRSVIGGGSDDFVVGDVKAATNPMFLQQQKVKGDNEEDNIPEDAAEAIRAMREPPPTELWNVYQRTYAELIERVNEMKAQYDGFSPDIHRMTESSLRGENVNANDFIDEDEVYLAAATAAGGSGARRMLPSTSFSSSKKAASSSSSSSRGEESSAKKLLGKEKAAFSPSSVKGGPKSPPPPPPPSDSAPPPPPPPPAGSSTPRAPAPPPPVAIPAPLPPIPKF